MSAPGFAIERERPLEDAALRRAIYGGRVFLFPPTDASRAFVARANASLRSELGDDPRAAHARFDDAELFARVGRVRRALYTEPEAHAHLAAMATGVGFETRSTAFDPARLRAIVNGAADNPRAAPVYYPHRDTWYGHPSSVVTVWTALDDLAAHETFVFYPQRFERAVRNDSESFDYDDWVSKGWSLKVGWQDRESSSKARYPGVLGAEDYGSSVGFACRAGEILVFSGAHFHRTLPQAKGRSRFSLDARMVHLGDHASGLGAPNVDGRARGSALRDYVRVHAGS